MHPTPMCPDAQLQYSRNLHVVHASVAAVNTSCVALHSLHVTSGCDACFRPHHTSAEGGWMQRTLMQMQWMTRVGPLCRVPHKLSSGSLGF